MRNSTGVICATLALGLLLQTPAEAAGSKPAPTPPPTPQEAMTPEQEAKAAYNLGLKHRDKAWSFEDKAKEAGSDNEREKLLGKAMKQYEKAIPLFQEATEKVATFHQAFSSLGYAYRKSGQHEKALTAYDKALDLAPFYGEALEYRGEAYLGLNRIEDAKEAYMQLFGSNRELADQLMEAMQTWLTERREDAAGVSSDDLDAFASWLQERGELAGQTARLTHAAATTW